MYCRSDLKISFGKGTRSNRSVLLQCEHRITVFNRVRSSQPRRRRRNKHRGVVGFLSFGQLPQSVRIVVGTVVVAGAHFGERRKPYLVVFPAVVACDIRIIVIIVGIVAVGSAVSLVGEFVILPRASAVSRVFENDRRHRFRSYSSLSPARPSARAQLCPRRDSP